MYPGILGTPGTCSPGKDLSESTCWISSKENNLDFFLYGLLMTHLYHFVTSLQTILVFKKSNLKETQYFSSNCETEGRL